MAKKEYIIVGVGYTAYFKTIKDRNSFKRQVNAIYKEMAKNPKFTNKTALHYSVSIAVAKAMDVKIEKQAYVKFWSKNNSIKHE